MDARIKEVLALYEQRMNDERDMPLEAPGGRDGGLDQRMRAINPVTGQFLSTIVKSLEAPTILELGTSFGYSGIWFAEAARATGGKFITMELHAYKSHYAQEMSAKAGLSDYVDFKIGDAVQMIHDLPGKIDFVFVDLWRDLYIPCLEAFYPKLNPGAIIVADNMLRPSGEELIAYGKAVRAKPHMRSVLLPVGSGMEVSRYEP
jgi:predicted O-methyltransferase YrrM